MRQKCRNCDKNCENGNLCFKCKPRKPFPKIGKKTTSSLIDIGKPLQHENNLLTEMNYFFFLIWQKRSHKSEISGEVLYNPISSAYFHHILPKKKYPIAEFDEENIVLLTLEEHDNVEMDMYKYEEINKKRELLKIKYNL